MSLWDKGVFSFADSGRRILSVKFRVYLLLLMSVSIPVFGGNTADAVIAEAESLLGTPYRYGGTTPAGFDCSGFITYLYKKYVPGLPRVSRDMASFGLKIRKKDLMPGDLVFFATGRAADVITHVALYAGDGVIIHSVSAGPETGVIATDINTLYWKRRYAGAVRILRQTERKDDNSRPSPPAAGEDTEKNIPEVEKEKSPWNSFDGYIEGDFNLYLEKERDAFEEWKKNN